MPQLTSEDVMSWFKLILTSCLKAKGVLLLVPRREVRDFKSQRVLTQRHFPAEMEGALWHWLESSTWISGPSQQSLSPTTTEVNSPHNLGRLRSTSLPSIRWGCIRLTPWCQPHETLRTVQLGQAANPRTRDGKGVLFKTAVTCASSKTEPRSWVFLCPFCWSSFQTSHMSFVVHTLILIICKVKRKRKGPHVIFTKKNRE